MWIKYPKIFRDNMNVFNGSVIVEEKLDGSNVGIHSMKNGKIRIQKRRNWIKEGDHQQYRHFERWCWKNVEILEKIPENYILYGEYMWAKHSIYYNKLPDWFICFDVWNGKKFLPIPEKTCFCEILNLARVPLLFVGKTTFKEAKKLISTSILGDNQMEGIVIKSYKNPKIMLKYTTQKFQKNLEDSEHWMNKKVIPNKLKYVIK